MAALAPSWSDFLLMAKRMKLRSTASDEWSSLDSRSCAEHCQPPRTTPSAPGGEQHEREKQRARRDRAAVAEDEAEDAKLEDGEVLGLGVLLDAFLEQREQERQVLLAALLQQHAHRHERARSRRERPLPKPSDAHVSTRVGRTSSVGARRTDLVVPVRPEELVMGCPRGLARGRGDRGPPAHIPICH